MAGCCAQIIEFIKVNSHNCEMLAVTATANASVPQASEDCSTDFPACLNICSSLVLQTCPGCVSFDDGETAAAKFAKRMAYEKICELTKCK